MRKPPIMTKNNPSILECAIVDLVGEALYRESPLLHASSLFEYHGRTRNTLTHKGYVRYTDPTESVITITSKALGVAMDIARFH